MNPEETNRSFGISQEDSEKLTTAVDSLAYTSSRPGWKDSPEGMEAFGRVILDNLDKPSSEVREQWGKKLRRHYDDVTGIENLLPAPVVTGITNAFDKRGCGLYPLLHKMSIESWELTKNMVDPSAAAGNYPRAKYGSAKVKQPLTIDPRLVNSQMIASCVEVDQSLRDTPADLVTYLSDELPARLVNTIEKAVLFPSVDARGTKTQGALFSVVADADADTAGGDQLSCLMASSMKAEAETPTIADLIKLNASVSADGPRVLIMSYQTLATAQLSAAGNGNFIGMGPDAVASILGVDRVLFPSWWTDDSQLGAEAIILVPSHYLLIGGDVNSCAQFTLDNTDRFRPTTDKFWSETPVGGSLDSACAAAVLMTPKA